MLNLVLVQHFLLAKGCRALFYTLRCLRSTQSIAKHCIAPAKNNKIRDKSDSTCASLKDWHRYSTPFQRFNPPCCSQSMGHAHNPVFGESYRGVSKEFKEPSSTSHNKLIAAEAEAAVNFHPGSDTRRFHHTTLPNR